MIPAKKVDWISSKEAAALIGKSNEWMTRIGRRHKKGPPWYEIGGQFLYDRDEVMVWLQAHRRGG